MWSMILLMSHLPGGHSMSAGRRPEKLGYDSLHSAGIGTARRLAHTERGGGSGGCVNFPCKLNIFYIVKNSIGKSNHRLQPGRPTCIKTPAPCYFYFFLFAGQRNGLQYNLQFAN